jgi:FtsP/CotA-like multicopper oxidase with cupredoxin domain
VRGPDASSGSSRSSESESVTAQDGIVAPAPPKREEGVNLDEVDHPFHIHTNPFLVTRIDGVTLAEPVWRDTVNVRGHGSVTLRSRFEDFTGRFVLHCHILNHEERGMMQTVEVYKDL